MGMAKGRIPLAVRIAYSAFVAVLVPGYWITYGPANFLYFCDLAAVVTLVGLWLQSPLLLSMEAVAILVPQAVWVVDFGGHLLGRPVLGMTGYMFDPKYKLWVRGLSLFHGWLPLLLVWAVRRVGYDRRAVWAQTVVGVGVLLVCYLAFAPPGTVGGVRPVRNINYVYGKEQDHQQQRTPPGAWLGIVIAVAVLGMFVPAHLLLKRIAPPPPARGAA